MVQDRKKKHASGFLRLEPSDIDLAGFHTLVSPKAKKSGSRAPSLCFSTVQTREARYPIAEFDNAMGLGAGGRAPHLVDSEGKADDLAPSFISPWPPRSTALHR